MSYDIELINRKTKQPLLLSQPQYIRGGTVKAELDENGNLIQAKETEASINITYNYNHYYVEATRDDRRFFKQEADAEGNVMESSAGIRGLYGKTAAESLPMLTDMIERIKRKYMDQETGKWSVTKRKKVHFYDENGVEYKDPINAILNSLPYRKEEEVYEVSEGDTSNYWESTAANAIIPLMNMLHMAVEHLSDKEVVWDGD
ncbi:hypothetical protein IMM1_31350 [Pseudocoprococcus immobilis]